jgi:hypothetical protein
MQPCHLWLYLGAAICLAFLLGLCGAPRYFHDRKKEDGLLVRLGETIRCVVWDALIQLIGFLLVPTLFFFGLVISDASSASERIVLGILFLPLFFYMIFCLSGRGVEVLHRTIMSGTKSIEINWRGIKIEFEKKDE